MRLVCIDFDGTIAIDHTHNKIHEEMRRDRTIRLDKEKQFNIARQIPPVVNNEKKYSWKSILESFVASGDHVVIVSFNDFPTIIPKYLKEVVGLSDELVRKILVISHMPKEGESKNEHIAEAKEAIQFRGTNKEIILVDDTPLNLGEAEWVYKGCQTILADPKTGLHLEKLFKLISETKVHDMHSEQSDEPEPTPNFRRLGM